MSVDVVGFELQRCEVVRDRFQMLALFGQHDAEVVVSVGVAGLEENSFAVMGNRFVRSAQLIEGGAEIIVSLGVTGFQPQGEFEARHGFSCLTTLGQAIAEVIDRIDVVGQESHGLAKARDGLLMFFLAEVDFADVIVGAFAGGVAELRVTPQGEFVAINFVTLNGQPASAQGQREEKHDAATAEQKGRAEHKHGDQRRERKIHPVLRHRFTGNRYDTGARSENGEEPHAQEARDRAPPEGVERRRDEHDDQHGLREHRQEVFLKRRAVVEHQGCRPKR